ncbi:MAG: iron ABC transporter permease [Gammaproteobacteria bacterium]|nr:iron ABC transporter permease [Gammaproteobacteria bacterium]MDH3505889.1 iron ABC transporter permease [Gammaproteobacteria bacterium]
MIRTGGRGPWRIVAAGTALAVLAPIAALVVTAASGSEDLWRDLIAFVLPVAARNTLVLLTGVGLLTALLGTGAAWLVAAHEFPGRRVFDWALLLPLAVPTYIVAYVYLDVLHPVGPVQGVIRALIGVDSPRDFRLPDIRSMIGCILLLSAVLYPYVYLTTRAMFMMQSANLIDVARTLGHGRRRIFFRVALPLARPAIAVGISLVLLETLNDIGAAEFLGVRTLTVSVYTTWITRSNLPGAAQLALAMLCVVVCVMALERWARRRRRYANDAQHPRPLQRETLRGSRGVLAAVACGLPVFVGFIVPAWYLIDATIARVRFAGVPPSLLGEVLNTVMLSAVATLVAVAAALAVVYAVRTGPEFLPRLFLRIASLGYAVPGTVLAIGLLPIITGIEAAVDTVATALLGVSTGLFLLGSGAAVIYAYVARFLAISAGSIEAGFSRVSPSMDAAARTLGATVGRVLWQVHLPMLKPALATGALLVFVDCMKELPATLLLRPLGFETLATHLYGEAIRGTYEDAAIAALLIVLAGILPVVVLTRVGARAGPAREAEAADGISTLSG